MTEVVAAHQLTDNEKWILNNSLSDGNYKAHLAVATLEELEYCLAHEKRKTGLLNLEWEKDKRIRQMERANKEKEKAETEARRQAEWEKTVASITPPPSRVKRTDLFGNVISIVDVNATNPIIVVEEEEDGEEEEEDFGEEDEEDSDDE